MLEEKGVEFHLNAGVKEIVQEEGKVERGGREGQRIKTVSCFLGDWSDAAVRGNPAL